MSGVREEINDIYQLVRARGDAFARAKQTRTAHKVWSPSDATLTIRDTAKISLHEMGGVVEYFNNVLPGGLECLDNDNFKINYNIYGDVDRHSMLGKNTRGLEIDVEWDYTPVEVSTYAGIGASVTVDPKLTEMTKHGVKDRRNLAAVTGLNRRRVEDASPDEMAKLMDVFKLSVGAQNKLTRLVKGCLMYIDLLSMGETELNVTMHVDSVQYGVEGLIGEFDKSQRAYVYSHWPDNQAYTGFIYLMSGAYPNQHMDCQDHVRIPSDGNKVYLVSHSAQTEALIFTLTASTAWASLMSYCEQFGIGHQLESAMVMACSLSENRYYSRIELPKVVSYPDLVAPALLNLALGFESKPLANRVVIKGIGRVHQMMSFVVGKDAIYAAINTTQPGHDYLSTIKSYLSSQEQRFLRAGYSSMSLTLLSHTASMKWLSVMTKEDMEEIIDYSILEGLWLVDQCDVTLRNGILQNMKHGIKDMMKGFFDVLVHVDDETVLEREIELAGIDYEDIDVPTGSYTMDVCYLDFKPDRSRLPDRTFTRANQSVAYSCEHTLGVENFHADSGKERTTRRARILSKLKKERDEAKAASRAAKNEKKKATREEEETISDYSYDEHLLDSLSDLSVESRDATGATGTTPPPRTFADVPLSRGPLRTLTPVPSRVATPTPAVEEEEEIIIPPKRSPPPERTQTPPMVVSRATGRPIPIPEPAPTVPKDPKTTIVEDEVDEAEYGLSAILADQMTSSMGRIGWKRSDLKHQSRLLEGLMDDRFLTLLPTSSNTLVNEIITRGRRNTIDVKKKKLRSEGFVGSDEIERMMLQGKEWSGTITRDLYPYLGHIATSIAAREFARQHGVGDALYDRYIKEMVRSQKSDARAVAQILEFSELFEENIYYTGAKGGG